MLRSSIAAALLAGGCYAPTISSGSACESACPGDLACIDHVCRAPGFVGDAPAIDAPDEPTIDGPPGDPDADGFADDVDNCPVVANADQHDEDADKLGDVCDPCPHLAGAATDSDGDGVGDACDPEPNVGKQRIGFFDPFTSDRPEWQLGVGMTREGETLRALAAGPDTAFAALNVPNGEVRIATGGTIVSIGVTPRQLAIAFGFDDAAGAYHYCELYSSNSVAGSIEVAKAQNGTYTSLGSRTLNGPLATGAWSMVIDESVAAQEITLRATVGGTPYAKVIGKTDTAPVLVASDGFTVFVRNADIRYDYWLVIETLP